MSGGVGGVDRSHHNDRINRSLRIVTSGGLMAAIRFAMRAFIVRAVEHNVAIKMTKFADVVVIFFARVVCRIETLFLFIP